MLNIVITMAGLGSRFKKAGYNIPKYQIIVHNKTLFEWSMESLVGFNESARYIFIVRKEDNATKFIMEKMKNFNISEINIIEIDELTDGQATTALYAKKYWSGADELIIYNIDTYVEANEMSYQQLKGDGFIPCFKAPGNHYSFVRTDDEGNVVEIREKKRISDNATLGLYYFKSCNLYEKIYNEYYKDNNNLELNEKYIAPLYNYMLEQGYKLYISDVAYSKVHVLGTPEELEEFKKIKI